MITFLKGKLIEKNPTDIVLDVNQNHKSVVALNKKINLYKIKKFKQKYKK